MFDNGNNIDFKSLYDEAGRLMPPGWYDCIVVESTVARSSTNKPMIKVKMVVETGPRKGNTLFNQFVVSADNPSAMRMFFNNMKHFGMDASFWGSNPTVEMIAQQLQGRRIRAEVVHREWPANSGVMRENVNAMQPTQLTGPLPPNLATGGSSAQPMMPPTPTMSSPTAAPPIPSLGQTPSATPPSTTTATSSAPMTNAGTSQSDESAIPAPPKMAF